MCQESGGWRGGLPPHRFSARRIALAAAHCFGPGVRHLLLRQRFELVLLVDHDAALVDADDALTLLPLSDGGPGFVRAIAVAGSQPVPFTVEESAWGPILHREPDGTALALRWTAHLPGALNFGLSHFARAGSLDEALAFANATAVPGQNLVIGDRSYSSWSLRGWLLTRFAGLPFETVIVPPGDASSRKELLLLSPHPLALLVLGKVAAHWVAGVLPLVLVAPVLALQFGLPASAIGVLVASLLLGSPVLSLVGSLGAALTLGLRGGGVLLSLLVLPLYIPVLIFGAGAVDATVTGLGGEGHLSLLAALTFASLGFAPWASAAALKIALE